MTSDADDALSWEGDEDRPARPGRPAPGNEKQGALPQGWTPVGRGGDTIGRIESDGTATSARETRPLSTPMLIMVGVIGGIYLLYTIGWIIGGLNLQGSALFLIPAIMYQVAVWAAVLAPALWFCAVWLLTRHSAGWVRITGFLAGAALLVPWPFVMTGAAGA